MSRTGPFACAPALSVTVLMLAACLAVPGSCDSPPIHVGIEKGGEIYNSTGANATNTKGAIFWNGNNWATDNTITHMYFTNPSTGERLKNYTTLADMTGGDGDKGVSVPGYSFSEKNIEYTAKSASGTKTHFVAVEYDILQPDGTTVSLLSRGDGRSLDGAYFTAYFEDKSGNTTCLSEGILVHFIHMLLPAALNETVQSNDWSFRLPTPSSQYWFDINGGSDMGGGTYHVLTRSLDLSRIGKGSSVTVASSVQIKYTAANGTLINLDFAPRVVSFKEDRPAAAKTPGAGPALLAAAVVLATLFVRRKRAGA